jgi:hypothetical protein
MPDPWLFVNVANECCGCSSSPRKFLVNFVVTCRNLGSVSKSLFSIPHVLFDAGHTKLDPCFITPRSNRVIGM